MNIVFSYFELGSNWSRHQGTLSMTTILLIDLILFLVSVFTLLLSVPPRSNSQTRIVITHALLCLPLYAIFCQHALWLSYCIRHLYKCISDMVIPQCGLALLTTAWTIFVLGLPFNFQPPHVDSRAFRSQSSIDFSWHLNKLGMAESIQKDIGGHSTIAIIVVFPEDTSTQYQH